MSVLFQNHVNRLSAVLAVCEKHQETWRKLPAFAAASKELTSRLETIRELQLARQSLVTGLTARKQQARAEAGEAALEAAGALHALADATGDAELAGRMAIERRDLLTGRVNANVDRAELVYEAAQDRGAELDAYGLGAAARARLRGLLDALHAAIRDTHENLAVRRGTAERLRMEMQLAEGLVRRRLDKLVIQFRGANPLFVEEYVGARKLVNRTATRAVPTEPEAPDADATDKSAA